MKNYLEHYYKKYPKSTIQDYIILLYQMVFGTGHITENPAVSLNDLKQEISSITIGDNYEELYEFVGYEFVRVNLRTYKKYKLSLNLLNEAFNDTTSVFLPDIINFDEELIILKEFLIEKGFKKKEIDSYFSEYIKKGYPVIHHSDIYKEEYKPSYRILHKKFITEELKFYQVKNFLDQFKNNSITYIAIDGSCGSGKSTISSLIEKEYEATIIHVDDFLDTSNSEIGINSNRIIDEVFNEIVVGKPLVYRKWDCKNRIYQAVQTEKVNPLVIFEGSFSTNNQLIDKYQGIIFLDIDYNEQIKRLTIRSKPLINKFINEWIPRENRFFEKYNIRFKADIIV